MAVAAGHDSRPPRCGSGPNCPWREAIGGPFREATALPSPPALPLPPTRWLFLRCSRRVGLGWRGGVPGVVFAKGCEFLLVPLGGKGLWSGLGRRWGVVFVGGSFFAYSWRFFCLQLSFFAHGHLRPLLDALSHCKLKAAS